MELSHLLDGDDARWHAIGLNRLKNVKKQGSTLFPCSAIPGAPGWDQDTEPAPLQKKILDILASLSNQ